MFGGCELNKSYHRSTGWAKCPDTKIFRFARLFCDRLEVEPIFGQGKGGALPPRVPSDLRTLAGSRPHDASITTNCADDGRHLLSAGTLAGSNQPGGSAAGGRCLTANDHFSIVVRKASDPYAGAVVDG